MVFPPSFVACDLETSGLDAAADGIIEVGLVRVDDGRITSTYSSLVKPRVPLSLRVKRLTGLDDSDFTGCPDWESVRESVISFIGDAPLIGHNIAFDVGFLSYHAGYRPRLSYDTYELARIVLPDLVSYRLEAICAALDVEYPVRHRALEDATAAAEVYIALCERAAALDPTLLADLVALLGRHSALWLPVFDNALRQSSAVFGATRIGAGHNPDQPELPLAQSGEPSTADLPAVDDIVGPSGTLAECLDAYEYRPQQLEMARSVDRALQERSILMVEAGTGTGKSFAYLVPSVLWAKRQGERVVVSTHTVNLQDQLIEKDVPVLRQGLPPFRVCLLKGRNNYLCLRRWYAAVNETAFEGTEAVVVARIMVWMHSTATGDRTELSMKPDEWRVWDSVAATSDSCAGAACRFYSACFVNRARRSAEQADVIITNHSLLLSDLKTENRLLPSYGALVIDEAHHLEDVATKQLGRSVAGSDFRLWAQRIRKLAAKIDKIMPEDARFLQRAEKEVEPASAELFRSLARVCAVLTEGTGNHLRLDRGAANLSDMLDVAGLIEQLQETAEDALERLLQVYRQFVDRTLPGTADEVLLSFELLLKDGRAALDDLTYILTAEDPNYVFWVERLDRDPDDCRLQAAPIVVGELLFNGLFDGSRPVVLTSATLTVDGSFGYFSRSTGINLAAPDAVRSLQLDSPFSYREQARLFVVNDLPSPVNDTEEAYLAGLCRAIEDLAAAAGGRTLVLFTAHRTLKLVYARLKPVLEQMQIDLLGHGIDGGRARLLESFRVGERTVLFGAFSFWEGIDIPGEALSCLIIVKLPFQPPNHPVTLARRELLKSRGKSDFKLLALPQAVLRFKQGFGRLIRTASDRGVVVVLDERVTTKRYGIHFLRSLPLRWEAAPLSDVTARVSNFLPRFAKPGTTEDQS